MLNDRIRIRKPSKMNMSLPVTETKKLKSSVNIKDMTINLNRNTSPGLNDEYNQT